LLKSQKRGSPGIKSFLDQSPGASLALARFAVGNKDLEKRASERARAQLPYLGIFAYAGVSCLQLLKSHVTSEGSKSLRLQERERGRCVKRLIVRKEGEGDCEGFTE